MGKESGNPLAIEGHNLPWLQEIDSDADGQSDVGRQSWNATWRDVVILSGDNVKVGTYNLTVHNLADPASFAEMRDMIVDAAIRDQRPYNNWRRPLDANNDGAVNADDASLLIDHLNQAGSQQLAKPARGSQVTSYFDCNRDGYVAPIDALWIVNQLNAPANNGAGEAEGEGEPVNLIWPPRRDDSTTAAALGAIPENTGGWSTRTVAVDAIFREQEAKPTSASPANAYVFRKDALLRKQIFTLLTDGTFVGAPEVGP